GGANLDPVPRTQTINVLSVNDAPIGQDRSLTTNEDMSYTFSASDFPMTDPYDPLPNTLRGVRITTLTFPGTLKFNFAPVQLGDFIDAAQIGGLVFTPAADGNGTPY